MRLRLGLVAMTAVALAACTPPRGEPAWHVMTSAGSQNLFGVQLVRGGAGWAVGDIDPRGFGGHMYRTTDGGHTWVGAVPKTEVLTGLHFIDQRTGWVAGYAGRIERTDDGGATWRVQRGEQASEVLNAIDAADRLHAWAVGARGLILRTEDGGTAWSTVDAGRREDLWAVRFVSPTRGWIAGHHGLLLETADGGATWQAIDSGTTNALYGLAVRPPILVAIGEEGVVASSDGGPWSVTHTANGANLNAIAVAEDGPFWAVGDRGALARSDDGRTWTVVAPVAGARLSAIALQDPRHGVAVGHRGTVLVLE